MKNRGYTVQHFLKHGIRGQVTIFIIIAVVVVALVGLFFTFQGKEIRDKLNIGTSNSNVDEINSFVEECLKESAETALVDVGFQGGYYNPPNLSIDYFYVKIPYYFYERRNFMPTKKKIENEISNHVKDLLPSYTKNFIDFPEYEIKQREIKVETEIKDEKVILKMEYPLTITKVNETKKRIKNFEIEIPVRLGIIYDTSQAITQEQIKDFENINLTCLLDLEAKNDLNIELQKYKNNTILFTIIDNNSKINNESYEFNFANKYKV